MNLPNSLTILRIFFVPLLVVVLLTRQPNFIFFGVPMNFAVWGVLILLTAAATDWADGYYARRREQITTLGILLDPVADKLLISAAFISLVEMQLVPQLLQAGGRGRAGWLWLAAWLCGPGLACLCRVGLLAGVSRGGLRGIRW